MNKITLYAGNPDNGKSTAAIDLVARVTTGIAFPNGSANALPPSKVLMLLGEDDLDDTAVPRLMAAGADLSKVAFEDVETDKDGLIQLKLDVHLPLIDKWLDEHPDIRLIVIDPISNYLGKANMVAEQETRSGVLIPLKRLAKRRKVAILLVMHLNKKKDLDAISRVGGAMAFIGVARCAWLFQRDPAGEDGILHDNFTMSRIKNNLTSISSGGGLAFSTRGKELRFKEGNKAWPPYVVWGRCHSENGRRSPQDADEEFIWRTSSHYARRNHSVDARNLERWREAAIGGYRRRRERWILAKNSQTSLPFCWDS